MKLKKIPLEKILAPETPVRSVASEEAMDDLIHSMEQFGLQEPIKVRAVGDQYEVIFGHRRLIAARALGWKKMSCIVEEVDAQTAALIALEENIKREEVNPYEEARYFLHLIQTYGMTQTEIANRLGYSKQQVHNRMELLKLDPTTIEYIQEKELSMTHGVELGRIGDLEQRANVRAHVLTHNLGTVATRHLVDQVLMLPPEVDERGRKVIPREVEIPEQVTHYKCAFCAQPGSKVKLNTLFVCGFCLEALAEGAKEVESAGD